MYQNSLNQYALDEYELNYGDQFTDRDDFYQTNGECKSFVPPSMRGPTSFSYQNNRFQGYDVNSHRNQNLVLTENHYPKIYNPDHRYNAQLNYSDQYQQSVKFQSPVQNFQSREHSIDLSKYVPIKVHQSIVHRYQTTLQIIKNQNISLIKKLNAQMQKINKLYQFTQSIVSSISHSFSTTYQSSLFDAHQQYSQKNISLEKKLLTPSKILENKIKSLNEKKAQQNKIKIQTIEKNSNSTNEFSKNCAEDFFDEDSFLVDETVQKFQNIKKMNSKDPKKSTFGIKMKQKQLNENNSNTEDEAKNQNQDHIFESKLISDFLNDYLCQKMTYCSKQQSENSKIQKKGLTSLFLKWRLESTGQINEKISKNIIQEQVVQGIRKRFVSCRTDSTDIIGLVFKDPEFYHICV